MNNYTTTRNLLSYCTTKRAINSLIEKITEIGGFEVVEKLISFPKKDIATINQLLYYQYVIDTNWDILNTKLKIIQIQKWEDITYNPFFVNNFCTHKEYTYILIPEKHLILKIKNTTPSIHFSFPLHYLYQRDRLHKLLPIQCINVHTKESILMDTIKVKRATLLANYIVNPTKLYLKQSNVIYSCNISYIL